jgi:hypothetical protein
MLSLSWLRGGVVYLGAATNAQTPLTTSYGTLVDFNLYQRQTTGELECKVIGGVLSAWLIASPDYNIDSTSYFSCIGMSIKESLHNATPIVCFQDITSRVIVPSRNKRHQYHWWAYSPVHNHIINTTSCP